MQAPPPVFQQQPWYFYHHSHVGGVAEGGDCIDVTSQLYRSPDGLFKGTVTEYGDCGIVITIAIFSIFFSQ